MNLQCLLGRHEIGAWRLRPRLIGTRVEWLRWERACTRQTFGPKPWRCRHVERRWFKVRVPRAYRGGGTGKAIDVEDYLKRIGFIAPAPERLQTSNAPPDEALSSLPR